MKFKVEIIRRHPLNGNPFYPIRIDGTGEATIRRWTMECIDEADVRRFFDEAKAQGHANVSGFELHSITPVPNAGTKARVPPSPGTTVGRPNGGGE